MILYFFTYLKSMVYRVSVQNNKRDIEPQNYEMNLLYTF